jgi:hypothetical protein
MADNFDSQVQDSIRGLYELTSRIDERVKIIAESAAKSDLKFEEVMKMHHELSKKISVLESKNGNQLKEEVDGLNSKVQLMEGKIIALEIMNQGHTNKWNLVIDAAVKVLVAIAAGSVIWHFGFTQ